jgi:hypothetical protein
MGADLPDFSQTRVRDYAYAHEEFMSIQSERCVGT